MGTSPHQSFSEWKSAWLASELLVSRGPSPRLWFLDAKQRLLTRITSLHGYQPSPVVLWMQISVISIRITSLYWSQPLPGAFACKPAPFGAELEVSIGPRPQLSSYACKQHDLHQNDTSIWVPALIWVFFSAPPPSPTGVSPRLLPPPPPQLV